MNYTGEIAALSAAFLWSFSSFIFTYATIKIGAVQLSLDRLIFASVLMIITIFAFGINWNINSWQIVFLLLSGFIGLVIGDTFLFKSFSKIGPRISMLIMSGTPALAVIIAFIVLGETLLLNAYIGIIITLTGIVIVVIDKQNVIPDKNFKISKKGVMYSFFGALSQAIGLILAKEAYLYGDLHSFIATFMRISSAIIIMLPTSIILGKYRNPVIRYKNNYKLLALVLAGSVIGPYLGITFSFLAIENTKIGVASTLMATVPIIMLPLSKIIYKEKLSWKSITGAFIAVTGVALLFIK